MTQTTPSSVDSKKTPEQSFIEFVKAVIFAVVIAVSVHTIAYKPFNIPSGSMKPTLLVGDYLFVSKFAYGYSRYSLPFSPPLFEGRIFDRKPILGDVIVFRGPNDDRDYVKRLIGMPGDRIQMRDGILHINGQPCPLKQIEDFQSVDEETGELLTYKQFIETLPNGVEHHTIKLMPFGASRWDNTEEYVVPEGHYFGVGDNRDQSADSRILTGIGYIPEQNLIGRADLLFFSMTAKIWQVWLWLTDVRYNRIFTRIK
ncbi:MAG: signal peptidase I [Caedimonadaceae bacterium]|nr:MAG: signal peptidase I [Caedimonadaceae bacterium]